MLRHVGLAESSCDELGELLRLGRLKPKAGVEDCAHQCVRQTSRGRSSRASGDAGARLDLHQTISSVPSWQTTFTAPPWAWADRGPPCPSHRPVSCQVSSVTSHTTVPGVQPSAAAVPAVTGRPSDSPIRANAVAAFRINVFSSSFACGKLQENLRSYRRDTTFPDLVSFRCASGQHQRSLAAGRTRYRRSRIRRSSRYAHPHDIQAAPLAQSPRWGSSFGSSFRGAVY